MKEYDGRFKVLSEIKRVNDRKKLASSVGKKVQECPFCKTLAFPCWYKKWWTCMKKAEQRLCNGIEDKV